MEAKNTTYHSYGNLFESQANLYLPKTVEELRAILVYCRENNKRITPAGSFHSFDRQNSGNDVVIGFQHFKSIVYNEEKHTVKVGPGAQWGAIFEVACQHQCILYTCITCTKPTAGGTLSVHSHSVWSPGVGKEGNYCTELEIMTTDGRLLTCSRTENSDLFYGVIAGFGMLGFIVSITYQLFYVGQPVEIAIDTVAHDNIDDLEKKFDLRMPEQIERLEDIRSQSSLFYSDGGQSKFLVYNRSYRVVAKTEKPSKFKFWQAVLANGIIRFFPSIVNPILRYEAKRPPEKQLLIKGLNVIHPGTFWTEPDYYWTTYCGPLLRPFGYKTFLHQMEHFIPMGEERVTKFTKKVYELLEKYNLHFFMFDVKYIPQDEPFVLSPSRFSDGFYVLITFMDYFDKTAIMSFYEELNDFAFELEGKISLAKNCFIKPALVEKMLRVEIEEFMQLKAKYDPDFRLTSNFFETHFPSYFKPQNKPLATR